MTPLRHPAIALLYTFFITAFIGGCVRSDDEGRSAADITDAGLDVSADEAPRVCVKNLDCDDGDSCTVDRCLDGRCTYGQGHLVLSGENLGLPLRPDAVGLTLEGDIITVSRGLDGVELYSISSRPASTLVAGPGRPDEELTCPCRGKGIGEECSLTDSDCIAPLPGGADAGVMLELTYTCQRPPAAPGRDALACIPEANAAPYTGAHLGRRGHILARAGRTVQIMDGDTAELIGSYRARDEVTDIAFIDDDTAAIAVYARGVEMVNIGNGIEPVRESLTDTNGRALDITVMGETLLVADGLVGLVAVDLTPEGEQTGVNPTIRTAGYTSRVVARDGLAITNEGGAGIGVYTVSDETFERIATLPVEEEFAEVGLARPLVFTAAEDGIRAYGVIDPKTPRAWASVESNLRGACLPGTDGCVSQCDTDMDCLIEGSESEQQRCIRGRCSFEWNLLEPGSPIRHFSMDGNKMVALLENGQFVLNEISGCVECRSDEDCPVGRCVSERCTACVCNDDCAGEQYCERGECVGGCQSDDDCGIGEVCNGGLCFDCETDDDCELGEFCMEGRCGETVEVADSGVPDSDAGSGGTLLGTACEALPDAEILEMPDASMDAGVDGGE